MPVTRNTCYANYVGAGDGLDHSGNYTLNGRPVDFSLYECPLDNSLPFTIFLLALLLVYLKRSKLNNPVVFGD